MAQLQPIWGLDSGTLMEQTPSAVYGGQAVIEGVMMRGPRNMAVAVRDPDGDIVLLRRVLRSSYRESLLRVAFVRGLVSLWDSLGIGIRSLSYSADVANGDEVDFEGPMAWGPLLLSLGLGIGLFFLVPAAIGQIGENWLRAPSWAGNLLEGIVRLMLVMGYIWAIGFLPDVKRLYGYHGAEHKTINAFESGAELTPQSVALFPLEHPRCGTAFLLMLVIFSILIFSILGPMPIQTRLISRLLLIPLLAALAYEYLRFTSKHMDRPLVRILVTPNLALQRLTTRQPDMDMIEVAIAAFNAMHDSETLGVVPDGVPTVVR